MSVKETNVISRIITKYYLDIPLNEGEAEQLFDWAAKEPRNVEFLKEIKTEGWAGKQLEVIKKFDREKSYLKIMDLTINNL